MKATTRREVAFIDFNILFLPAFVISLELSIIYSFNVVVG